MTRVQRHRCRGATTPSARRRACRRGSRHGSVRGMLLALLPGLETASADPPLQMGPKQARSSSEVKSAVAAVGAASAAGRVAGGGLSGTQALITSATISIALAMGDLGEVASSSRYVPWVSPRLCGIIQGPLRWMAVAPLQSSQQQTSTSTVTICLLTPLVAITTILVGV